MQATIRIDRTLIEQAMSLAGLSTKRATVEEALRQLIRRSKQQQVRNLRGKLHWEGDLAEMRIGRTDVTG
ncbi:MAG: type II toxin-antitoxin system VapB family antitoxin [Smithellaceae bacterium]